MTLIASRFLLKIARRSKHVGCLSSGSFSNISKFRPTDRCLPAYTEDFGRLPKATLRSWMSVCPFGSSLKRFLTKRHGQSCFFLLKTSELPKVSAVSLPAASQISQKSDQQMDVWLSACSGFQKLSNDEKGNPCPSFVQKMYTQRLHGQSRFSLLKTSGLPSMSALSLPAASQTSQILGSLLWTSKSSQNMKTSAHVCLLLWLFNQKIQERRLCPKLFLLKLKP